MWTSDHQKRKEKNGDCIDCEAENKYVLYRKEFFFLRETWTTSFQPRRKRQVKESCCLVSNLLFATLYALILMPCHLSHTHSLQRWLIHPLTLLFPWAHETNMVGPKWRAILVPSRVSYRTIFCAPMKFSLTVAITFPHHRSSVKISFAID